MRTIIGLALLICSGSAAKASFYTGNELYQVCTTPSQNVICLGYIAGVVDTLSGVQNSLGTPCFGSGPTLGQLKDVVVRELQLNPQIRHYPAGALAAKAFYEAFPCKK